MVGISVIHVWLILIATLFTKAKFVCPVCYHINTVPPVYNFSFNCSRVTISKATTVIYLIIGGAKFAGITKDACQEQGLTCPLKPGTENTFKTVLISQAFLSSSKCIVLIIAKFRLYLRIRLLLC